MKRLLILTSAITSLVVALNSCAVDELDPPVAQSATVAVITTAAQGAQAFGSVLQARDYFLTSTHLFKYLGDFGLNIMAADPTLTNVNTDIACTDGGTYKYSGTVTGTSYDLDVSFSGCREKKFQHEGAMKVTGSPGAITAQLGGGSGTLNVFYFNDDYSVLVAYLQTQMSFTMNGSGTASNAAYMITPTGSITAFDYFLLSTFTLMYSRPSTSYTISTDTITGDETTSIAVSGYLTEITSAFALTITLTNFQIDRVKRYNAGSGSFTGDDTTLSGSVNFNYRPNSFCFEGTHVISTTAAVHTDYTLGYTTQGTMTLSGIATAQYNADGSIDITVPSSGTLHYTREYKLMKQCDYCGLELALPPLLGATGVASGSTMTITLTWFGPSGSASDMDLHLKYYNTLTPNAATLETWHMDWHQGKSYPGTADECSDPSGLTFGDAFDIDPPYSGTCDVGLDFDDVNGYGPEHITALKLPTGYYIVSVNSYDLHGDSSATLYLAIHVGDNIYGPYSTTLTADDGEDIDPASWFRVADVIVDGSGAVQIISPNGTLTPWH